MLKKSIIVLLLALTTFFAFAACKGEDGVSPTIEISEDGYWVINGEKTEVKAAVDGSSDSVSDENPQGLAFYLKDDGTYAVEIGYAKYLSKIVIPATYKSSTSALFFVSPMISISH